LITSSNAFFFKPNVLPPSANKRAHMTDNILTDLGENYEYARTIVNNTIELKKIEVAENLSTLVGKTIVSIMLGIVVSAVVMLGIIAFVFLLYYYFDSVLKSLAIVAIAILTLSVIIYSMRKQLIYRPITKMIYSALLKITT